MKGRSVPCNISAFFMGKYAITQEQYEVVMGNNPSDFKGSKLPVEQVSWNDAVEFCQRRSQKTGKIYRLPSEAEWEYACRAGTTTPFYFGETITPDLVNYDGNYPYGARRRDFTANKQRMWGVFRRIRLVCMICTGMFGNGAVIAITIETIARCGVVVPGTTLR